MRGSSSLRTGLPSSATCLLLAGLIQSRPLSNAVVVAFPDDIGVSWKGENAFDRLPVPCQYTIQSQQEWKRT